MHATLLRYTAPVPAKKAGIGIGVPNDRAVKAAQPHESAAFFFRAPFTVARWEGRKARRFKGSARSPVRQSCRAATLIGVRVAVVSTTDLERLMAHPIAAACAAPALTLGSVPIRQHGGLFSLNDLHRASGGQAGHRPGEFLRNEQTKALIAEIETAGISAAYAAWISAAFHLRVIRVFLAASPAPDPARLAQAAAAARALVDAAMATIAAACTARLATRMQAQAKEA